MKIQVLALVALVVFLQGCSTATTAVDSAEELSASLFAPRHYGDAVYRVRLKELRRGGSMGEDEKAFTYDYIDVINANYGAYVAALTSGRAATNIAYDTLNLGLTGGAAVAGATSVKTALAALSTFFQGQKQSVDKNIFNDQAVFALTSVMEVRRTQVLTRIRKKMIEDDYTLGDALIDLDEFYRAGSMQNALQASFLNQAALPSPAPADPDGKVKNGAPGAATSGTASPQPQTVLPASTSPR